MTLRVFSREIQNHGVSSDRCHDTSQSASDTDASGAVTKGIDEENITSACRVYHAESGRTGQLTGRGKETTEWKRKGPKNMSYEAFSWNPWIMSMQAGENQRRILVGICTQ